MVLKILHSINIHIVLTQALKPVFKTITENASQIEMHKMTVSYWENPKAIKHTLKRNIIPHTPGFTQDAIQ